MEKEYPKRKHPRLKDFDYSSGGAYFITICTYKRRKIFSDVITADGNSDPQSSVAYTKFGHIAEKQLLLLENRYPNLAVDRYVIMPNHIHVIFFLNDDTAGVNPRLTVMDVVCAYKSLTSKDCKDNGFNDRLFQTSFYEHVIRNKDDYDNTVKYILENPTKWYFDEMYSP